jgi:glycosyltransferase involved in cell wall biosynthesis
MTEWPRITVVTPSFNQGAFIEATLKSVISQNYPNLQHIVLDGGSTDNSVEIIRRYEPHIAYWHSRKDKGQADALQQGFAMADGEILCWLNSDDIFLPEALNTVGRLFAKHEDVDFIYGNRCTIDRDGNVTGRHIWPWHITKWHWALGQPLAQECSFFRKSIYERVGGIDPTKFFIMDYDLFFRMWRAGRFRKTTAFLGCLRQHEETKNARHVDVWQRELAEAKKKYGLRDPGPIRRRIMNRTDRLQVMLENLVTKHVIPSGSEGSGGAGAA